MRSVLFSCLLTQHPFCSPWIKEYFDFKFYYLRNMFLKVIAVIDVDSSDVSGQSHLKTFWKAFTVAMSLKTFVIHGKRSKYQH